MKTLAIASIALLGTLLPAGGQDANESFKLFHARPAIPAGTTFDFTQTMELERAAMTAGGDPKSEPIGHSWFSASRKMSWRILNPDKFALILGSSKSSTAVQFVGREKSSFSPDVKDSLEGAKILCEKTRGKWLPKLIGREPTADERTYLTAVGKSLDEKDNDDREIYGKREFKVGDTLKIKKQMLPMNGFAEANITGSATLTIDRIETLDGVRCAVLTGSVEQRGESTRGDQVAADVTLKGKMTIWRSIEYSTDLKIEGDGTIQRTERGDPKKRMTTGPVKIRIRAKIRKTAE